MELEAGLAPATLWNPMLPGVMPGKSGRGENSTFAAPIPAHRCRQMMPTSRIASVAQLSRWIQSRQITSERLTEIYIDRLQQFDPKLHCVITLTRDHALEQARRRTPKLPLGSIAGRLHGIPWGAKDLLDTAGIPTTYGAEPYRDRVPEKRQRGR